MVKCNIVRGNNSHHKRTASLAIFFVGMKPLLIDYTRSIVSNDLEIIHAVRASDPAPFLGAGQYVGTHCAFVYVCYLPHGEVVTSLFKRVSKG